MSTASLLLPLTAAAESHVQTAARGGEVSATGHVDFKIIIPRVLSLQVGNSLALDAGTMTVMSNGHTISVNAAERTANSSTHARGNLILTSAARKGVAQDARCSLGRTRTTAVVCTASTP